MSRHDRSCSRDRAALANVSEARAIGPFLDGLLTLPIAQRQLSVDMCLADGPCVCQPGRICVDGRDVNGWTPGMEKLSQVPATSPWYRAMTYEAVARLDYNIVIDGSSWINAS